MIPNRSSPDLRNCATSLRMMEALGELLALLPGCDVLEEQK